MKIRKFTAPTAKEAIEAVNCTLGSDAVVVNIRKLSKPGWQGLFQSPQVEVSAVMPSLSAKESDHSENDSVAVNQATPSIAEESFESTVGFGQAGSRLDIVDDTPIEIPKAYTPPLSDSEIMEPLPESFNDSLGQSLDQATFSDGKAATEEGPDIGQVLEGFGMLPLQVERLLRLARQRFPNLDSCQLGDQVHYIRHCLIDYWNNLAKVAEENSHPRKVLIGPPGSGKTTVLCKWLTHTVLAKRQPAKVWRLDGHIANAAELLTVHAEMLDVEVNRVWYPEPVTDGTIQFFDLPGVMSGDSTGLDALRQLANEVSPAEFILVLNSAYELDHLVRSVREFSDLPINGLIVTHMDEESKWSKLWNLTLETGLPILHCSGGQEIPGDFVQLTSQMLFQSVIQPLELGSSLQS